MTNLRQITAQESVQEDWIEELQNLGNVPILLITAVEDEDGNYDSTIQVPGYVPPEMLIQALESTLWQVKADMEATHD